MREPGGKPGHSALDAARTCVMQDALQRSCCAAAHLWHSVAECPSLPVSAPAVLQARAAARLLARQRRPGEGLAQPARPRGAVPIRGSRQANAAAAAGSGGAAPAKRAASKSSGGRRKRRKGASSRSAWSDEDEEDPELEAALEAEDEEESRSEQLSEASEEEAGEERGSGGEEGRSAGTTSASPGARARGGGRAPLMRATQQESDAALQLEQLVERLTSKDSGPDAATVAGLAARRDNLMAAAAAAAAALGPPVPPPRQPTAQQSQAQGQGHPYIEVKQEAPTLGGDLAAGLAAASGSSMLSASTAAAAMQRQAALEQALLEQSMWVQKLAAEVQVRSVGDWVLGGWWRLRQPGVVRSVVLEAVVHQCGWLACRCS